MMVKFKISALLLFLGCSVFAQNANLTIANDPITIHLNDTTFLRIDDGQIVGNNYIIK